MARRPQHKLFPKIRSYREPIQFKLPLKFDEDIVQPAKYNRDAHLEQIKLIALNKGFEPVEDRARDISMNFPYGENARWSDWEDGPVPGTTIDAIEANARTSTIRWGNEAKKFANLKEGDRLIAGSSIQDKQIPIIVTGLERVEIDPTDINAGNNLEILNRLSKTEGWSVEHLFNEFKQRGAGLVINYRKDQGQNLSKSLSSRTRYNPFSALRNSTEFLPPVLKDYLAKQISSAYETAYQEFGGEGDIVEFFENNPDKRNAVQKQFTARWMPQLANMRLDVNKNFTFKDFKYQLPDRYYNAFQSTMSRLSGAKSIGDVEKLLASTTIPTAMRIAFHKVGGRFGRAGQVFFQEGSAPSSDTAMGIVNNIVADVMSNLPGFNKKPGDFMTWSTMLVGGKSAKRAIDIEDGEKLDLGGYSLNYEAFSSAVHESPDDNAIDILDEGLEHARGGMIFRRMESGRYYAGQVDKKGNFIRGKFLTGSEYELAKAKASLFDDDRINLQDAMSDQYGDWMRSPDPRLWEALSRTGANVFSLYNRSIGEQHFDLNVDKRGLFNLAGFSSEYAETKTMSAPRRYIQDVDLARRLAAMDYEYIKRYTDRNNLKKLPVSEVVRKIGKSLPSIIAEREARNIVKGLTGGMYLSGEESEARTFEWMAEAAVQEGDDYNSKFGEWKSFLTPREYRYQSNEAKANGYEMPYIPIEEVIDGKRYITGYRLADELIAESFDEERSVAAAFPGSPNAMTSADQEIRGISLEMDQLSELNIKGKIAPGVLEQNAATRWFEIGRTSGYIKAEKRRSRLHGRVIGRYQAAGSRTITNNPGNAIDPAELEGLQRKAVEYGVPSGQAVNMSNAELIKAININMAMGVKPRYIGRSKRQILGLTYARMEANASRQNVISKTITNAKAISHSVSQEMRARTSPAQQAMAQSSLNTKGNQAVASNYSELIRGIFGRDVNIAVGKTVGNFAHANRAQNTITLGDNFFDEKVLLNSIIGGTSSDVGRLQTRIVLHEAAHLFGSRDIEKRFTEIFSRMPSGRRDLIMANINEKYPEGHPYRTTVGMAREVEAEAYVGAMGFETNLLEDLFGLEENEIKELLGIAREHLDSIQQGENIPFDYGAGSANGPIDFSDPDEAWNDPRVTSETQESDGSMVYQDDDGNVIGYYGRTPMPKNFTDPLVSVDPNDFMLDDPPPDDFIDTPIAKSKPIKPVQTAKAAPATKQTAKATPTTQKSTKASPAISASAKATSQKKKVKSTKPKSSRGITKKTPPTPASNIPNISSALGPNTTWSPSSYGDFSRSGARELYNSDSSGTDEITFIQENLATKEQYELFKQEHPDIAKDYSLLSFTEAVMKPFRSAVSMKWRPSDEAIFSAIKGNPVYTHADEYAKIAWYGSRKMLDMSSLERKRKHWELLEAEYSRDAHQISQNISGYAGHVGAINNPQNLAKLQELIGPNLFSLAIHKGDYGEPKAVDSSGVPLKSSRGKWDIPTYEEALKHPAYAGYAVLQKGMDDSQYRTYMNPGESHVAMQEVSRAYSGAIGQGYLPDTPEALLKTIKLRMHNHIKDWASEYIKKVEATATSPDQVAETIQATEKIKTVAGKMINEFLNVAETSVTAPGKTLGDWRDSDGDIYLGQRADRIKAFASKDPALAKRIRESGGAEALAMGPTTVLEGEDGQFYTVGGGSGTGGGFFNQRKSPYGSFFNSRPGQLLYGAYITKRMAAMTIGPVMQEAEYYGQKINEPLASVTGDSLGTSWYGSSVRASLTRDLMARGAYEQWGGIQDATYSFVSANPWVSRAMSGFGVGAGIAGLGITLPMMMGMAGLGEAALGAGSMLGTGLVGAGVAIMGGAAVMEARNALYPDEEPWTYGNMVRGATTKMAYTNASRRLAEERGQPLFSHSSLRYGTGWNVSKTSPYSYNYSEEDVISAMTPEERALYTMTGETEEGKAIDELGRAIKMVTGEELQTSAPVLRSLKRGLGSIVGYEDKILDFLNAGWESGYSSAETGSRFENLKDQLGIRSGSSEAFELLKTMSGGDESKIKDLEYEASVISRYAGAVSGFYKDPRNANAFIASSDVRTQARGGALSSIMSVFDMAGFAGDDVAYYAQTADGFTPMTYGEVAGNYLQQYGPIRGQIAASVGMSMVQRGVAPTTAMNFAGQYGVFNETQAGYIQGVQRQAEQFGVLTPDQVTSLGASAAVAGPYKGGIYGGIAETFAAFGFDFDTVYKSMANSGLNNAEATEIGGLVNRMASGDLSAWGYHARVTGNLGHQWTDKFGGPVYQTDMKGLIELNRGQYAQGNAAALNLEGMSYREAAHTITGGHEDERAISAWLGEDGGPGGAIGRGILHAERMYNYQMAGIGLSMQGLEMGWAHTQQMWTFEDRQRKMQHKSQMTDFAVAEERMGLQNYFAEQQEALSWKRIELNEQFGGRSSEINRERMILGHENQLWNLNFNRGVDLLQRGWTQEDWGYEDDVRSLNNQWAMEDINEAIRYSHGRERRMLVKQRDRMGITQGLEENQIEKQRERQQEMWDLEDKRFDKQEEYIYKLIDLDSQQYTLGEEQRNAYIELDKEQWELSKAQRLAFAELDRSELERQKDEYLKLYALQNKQIAAERQHQEKQYELQVQQLNIQAASAAEAYNYQMALMGVTDNYDRQKDIFTELMKNDPSQVIENLSDLFGLMTTGGFSKAIRELRDLIESIGKGPSGISEPAQEHNWDWDEYRLR